MVGRGDLVPMATATPTDLTDARWTLLQALLPPHARRGRPRADDRRTIDGILWVLRTGARWADLPRRYGASSTCHLPPAPAALASARRLGAALARAACAPGCTRATGLAAGSSRRTFIPAKKGGGAVG